LFVSGECDLTIKKTKLLTNIAANPGYRIKKNIHLLAAIAQEKTSISDIRDDLRRLTGSAKGLIFPGERVTGHTLIITLYRSLKSYIDK
jgi:hypothetical protein